MTKKKTLRALVETLEKDIRSTLVRHKTEIAALDRRVVDVEASLGVVVVGLTSLKDDMGRSLGIVIGKLDKVADRVGAAK